MARTDASEVIGEEEADGRPCWEREARARDHSVTYPRRLIWIDKQSMMPLLQGLFALSGLMLKTWIMSEIEMVSGRPVARLSLERTGPSPVPEILSCGAARRGPPPTASENGTE